MKNIEEQIWDYVTGTCSADEQKALADLIDRDPAVKLIYEEIKALHFQLNQLELDEPSMGFEQQIMTKVAAEPLPGNLSNLIDKRIIYGIAAFFVLSISGLLGFAFYQLYWSTAGTMRFEMPKMDWNIRFNKTFMFAFLSVDVVLGLYFMDYFLRKKLD